MGQAPERVEYVQGDLLASGADILVNPVNCVGVMGAGLALTFKKAYPDNFESYATACKNGIVCLGSMYVTYATPLFSDPIAIVNFPTKNHWKDKSDLNDIHAGLADLKELVTTGELSSMSSIAVPMIGCGLGGLKWSQVRPLIEEHLGSTDLDVLVYGPAD